MKNSAIQVLSGKGLKLTRGRIAILSRLIGALSPLSCEDIYQDMIACGEKVNLSTVYRTLSGMTKSGIINPVNISGSEKALYEYSPNAHRHHLVCIKCNKILPLSSCPLGDYQAQVAKKTGFVIKGHNLDMYGFCPDCTKP